MYDRRADPVSGIIIIIAVLILLPFALLADLFSATGRAEGSKSALMGWAEFFNKTRP